MKRGDPVSLPPDHSAGNPVEPVARLADRPRQHQVNADPALGEQLEGETGVGNDTSGIGVGAQEHPQELDMDAQTLIRPPRLRRVEERERTGLDRTLAERSGEFSISRCLRLEQDRKGTQGGRIGHHGHEATDSGQG